MGLMGFCGIHRCGSHRRLTVDSADGEAVGVRRAQLGERLGARGVSCVAFATPPVVTRALAVEACGYIQSVVYHHDVVPRASLAGFEGLRQEMLATQWEQRLQTEVPSPRPSPRRRPTLSTKTMYLDGRPACSAGHAALRAQP